MTTRVRSIVGLLAIPDIDRGPLEDSRGPEDLVVQKPGLMFRVKAKYPFKPLVPLPE